MKRPNHDKYLLALAWLSLAWLTTFAQGATSAYGVAKAQDAARVYLAPAEPALAAGETTTLAIRAAGATDLYGVELHLAYDPAVMKVLDADASRAGVQLSPGDMLDPAVGFMVANRADNQAGELDYALTLLAPAEAVSGDGILVSFEVEALAEGSSQLTLSAILASAEGISLPVTVEGGRLTVGSGVGAIPSPTPPATTAGPRATAAPPTAIPSNTPTATSQSSGQPPTATPATRQQTPAAGQTAPAGSASPTSGAPLAGQPGAGDMTDRAQAGPTETVDALAGPVTLAAGEEDQPVSGEETNPSPSPNAVPIAPSDANAPAESGQDDNSALAGVVILAVFLLVALVVFFGRRLLSRKL